jgi:hypothetical protein
MYEQLSAPRSIVFKVLTFKGVGAAFKVSRTSTALGCGALLILAMFPQPTE